MTESALSRTAAGLPSDGSHLGLALGEGLSAKAAPVVGAVGRSPLPGGRLTLVQRFRSLAHRRTPALVKVLFAEFGPLMVSRSAAALLACAALISMTGAILPRYLGMGAATGAVLLELALCWWFKGLDSVGQLLCARGLIQENLSRFQEARNSFLAAVNLLKFRDAAYQGLYRVSETKEEIRGVARLIQGAERNLSGALALLVARCWREAGDPQSARPHFERADKLASSGLVKLDLAEAFLATGLPERCLEVLGQLAQPDSNGHCFFLRARALRVLGRPEEALLAAQRAAQVRPCDPDYQVEKGRILEELGRYREAERQYTKAIRVHDRHAEALYRRALLGLRRGNRTGANQDLERCYSVQNTFTEAYLFAHSPAHSCANSPKDFESNRADHLLAVAPAQFNLTKGETVRVEIAVRLETAVDKLSVAALEPFGGGLEVKPSEAVVEQVAAGCEYRMTFLVKAKRPDAVNLNAPWILNFVLIAGNCWASRLVSFWIRDPAEGRVFWVLTNDHEPRPHVGKASDNGRAIMLPEQFERDLIRNGELAVAAAERHGLKWSHMLDAGGAVSLLRWAGDRSEAWDRLRRKAEAHYRNAFERGHDCQLHLHLTAVPETALFCYGFDRNAGTLFFDRWKRSSVGSGTRVGSWANVTSHYGANTDVRTRTGSLARTGQLVTSVLREAFPHYRPVFFRAGQWDMGASAAEREKSVLALRENGILADSSVAQGYDCYEKPFRFGAPPSRSAYFTFRNDPEKRAPSLADAGMLEILPILLPQGRHPMTPRDDPKAVVAAYRGLLTDGKVKSGRHVIMEIEHLATIGDRSDETGATCDWESIEHHFDTVRRACPALEGMSATEAIYDWLDYYSPELVVRLLPPQAEPKSLQGTRTLLFPMRFLGRGILTEDERPYPLVVPLPALEARRNWSIRILESGTVVFDTPSWRRARLPVRLSLSERNQHQFVLEIQST